MTTFSLPPLNITEDNCQEIQSRIGQRICPFYDNSNNFITPTMQNRLTITALSSIAATAALFAVAASCSFVAIILLTSSSLGVYYIVTIKDYDNPQERAFYVQQIARTSLTPILYEYTREDVINYALLGNVEPRVYVAFERLTEIFNNQIEWTHQQASLIDRHPIEPPGLFRIFNEAFEEIRPHFCP